MPTSSLRLAVALDGAGWHPAAWRAEGARPGELFTARYWADLAQEAERGLLDFVTIDDSLTLQSARRGVPDDRVDQVRGRLDAVLVAARVAPTTSQIGIVPVATTTHTEPFHISKAIATLDYVSAGRAGVQVRASGTRLEAEQFGRRVLPDLEIRADNLRDPVVQQLIAERFDEAADYVEVLRRLWDSWEDDAEIRDVSHRAVRRPRQAALHRLRGTVVQRAGALDHAPPPAGPAVGDRPGPRHDPLPAGSTAGRCGVRHAPRRGRRREDRGGDPGRGGRRRPPARPAPDLRRPGGLPRRRAREPPLPAKDHLDELDGDTYRSDAFIFAGTPAALAEHLLSWQAEGLAGFRLRPGTQPHDLEAITRRLVPLLQQRGAFRHRYEEATLRGRLGLDRPANRYAAV